MTINKKRSSLKEFLFEIIYNILYFFTNKIHISECSIDYNMLM